MVPVIDAADGRWLLTAPIDAADGRWLLPVSVKRMSCYALLCCVLQAAHGACD
jgi:hypothetical protein